MKLLSTKDISIVSVAFNKIMSSSIFQNQFFEIIKSLQKEKKKAIGKKPDSTAIRSIYA